MRQSEAHEPEKLTRYAFGDLAEKERVTLEGHLRTCAPCRDFLSFVQDFNIGLREARPQTPLPGEPCPDPSLLIALEDGELNQKTAEHVRAHILFCKECQKEYRALQRMRPKIIDVVLRAVGRLIEVLRPPEVGVWQSLVSKVVVAEAQPVLEAPFRVTELLIDQERNKGNVALRIEEGVGSDQIRVIVETDAVLPEWKWAVYLFDSEEEEYASMPLYKPEIQVTRGIPYGFYWIEIRKEEQCLGTFKFTVEPFSANEALEKAREYREENADYDRALAILEDVHRRDRENDEVLQELNLTRKLAAEEKEAPELDEEDAN